MALTELRRGRVCLALKPFAVDFPLEARVGEAEQRLPPDLKPFQTIEELEKVLAPRVVPKALVSFKLRRVHLLDISALVAQAAGMA